MLPGASANMARNQTAAQAVFGIYELLDIIFRFVFWKPESPNFVDGESNSLGRQSAGFLLVNKLWFELAVNHIWRGCGGAGGPSRRDLAKLVKSKERLQTYAKCIEYLYIEEESYLEYQRNLPKEQKEDRLRLKQLLPEIEFPRLKKIYINDRWSRNFNPFTQVPTHLYLRDSLKTLHISTSPPPSFWAKLKNRSPHIENIVQCWRTPANVDPNAVESFQGFLSASTSLTRLMARYCEDIHTLGTFECLARIRTLKALYLGKNHANFIEEEWIRGVLSAVSDPFPSLEILEFHTTHVGVGLLVPYLEKLQQLYVSLQRGEPDANFKVFRNHHLRILSVKLDLTCVMDGQELLELATSCPKLVSIYIGDGSERVKCRGIKDTLIERFVQLLPDLETFELYGNYSGLTEKAWFHFGRNCKSLLRLRIPADLDFIKLADRVEDGLFPVLKHFVLIKNPHKQQNVPTQSFREFRDIPKRLAQMMPSGETFEARGVYVKPPQGSKGNKTPYELDEAVKNLLKARQKLEGGSDYQQA